MPRLQIGFADKISSGSFRLPVRLTPVDVPLTSATLGRAQSWARDLVGILGALGYGISHVEDSKQIEVSFKGIFVRVRA